MADLFISYRSTDRAWAERLYTDIRAAFPDISIFWDQDRNSLPLGNAFRPALEDAAATTTNLVCLWSADAAASVEVMAEVQAFLANRRQQPTIAGMARTLFSLPLDGTPAAGMNDIQGLAAIRDAKTYDPTVADRGLSTLASDPHRTYWERIVRDIGTTIQRSNPFDPVSLVIVAMNSAMASELDHVLTRIALPPLLRDLLTAYGLYDPNAPDPLGQVKTRYHASALDWRPFGSEQTVWDLMDEVRVRFNANAPNYSFRWEPWDLLEAVRSATDFTQLQRALAQRLGNKPFFVVVDPITLYHPLTTEVFPLLQEFAEAEQSVLMSLSLNREEALNTLFESLRTRASTVLREFFQPNIPARGAFWGCGLNLQHPIEIERLVRRSLGVLHRNRLMAQEKQLTRSV